MDNGIAVVDADPLIYIVGFSNDGTDLEYQCNELDRFIEKILERSGCSSYVGFLTGKGNFREKVATIQPYKGNRDKSHRPEFYGQLRSYLIDVHGMTLVEGMEADDACGIYHYQNDTPTVICTLDKDLDMLAGLHYNYKKDTTYFVSTVDAWRNFYLQVLIGDSGDHIPGMFKVTGKKAMKKVKDPLLEMDKRECMESWAWSCYYNAAFEEGSEPSLEEIKELEDKYKEIKQLLWIRRKDPNENAKAKKENKEA